MGKDGSQWKHGYIPENGAAVALKMHRKPGSKSGGSKSRKTAKPAVDLSTREAREKALKNVDISTPAGRALVARAQRASLYSTKISVAPGTDPVAARAALSKAAAARKAKAKAKGKSTASKSARRSK